MNEDASYFPAVTFTQVGLTCGKLTYECKIAFVSIYSLFEMMTLTNIPQIITH